MTAHTVADAIKEFKLADQVSHKTMIIPGLAARLQGEVEDLAGWTVWVGPQDSSGIMPFLQKKWSPKGPAQE
jgi:acetyl-CoA decarbonylase/synthase complex subunit gamma